MKFDVNIFILDYPDFMELDMVYGTILYWIVSQMDILCHTYGRGCRSVLNVWDRNPPRLK